MSNTKSSRSGTRFNLFDVILLLAVLCCIGGIVVHAYFISDLNETYSENATIAFTVSGVSPRTAEAFCNAGDSIYLSENDHEIGSLLGAYFSPQSLYLETADGELVSVSHPEKMDITGELTLTGTWTNDGFLIGGTTLAIVGKTMNIYTPNAVCTLTITNVYPQLQKK